MASGVSAARSSGARRPPKRAPADTPAGARARGRGGDTGERLRRRALDLVAHAQAAAGAPRGTVEDPAEAASDPADDLDRAVTGELVGRLEPDAGDLCAHGVGRDVRQRGDPLRDPAGVLWIEADDDVGEVRRRAARSNPNPRLSATTSAATSIAAASATPSPVSSERRRRVLMPWTASANAALRRTPSIRASSAASRPSRRCSTRSAIAAASGSWVTITTARRVRLRSSASTVAPLPWSRFPVGSSASTSSGSLTSARAIASRCCSPPESSWGRRPAISLSPSSPIRRRARCSPPRSAPGRRAGSRTFSSPLSSSIRWKDWNTNPT